MKKIFLILSTTLYLISCSDLDDNISPNMPVDSDLNPVLKLNAAEVRTHSAQSAGITRLSSIWTNTYAGNHYYFANPLATETNLNITSSTYQNIWNDNYLAIASLQALIDGNNALSTAPYHVAIAKILKANYMHYLVDFYGDIPYTEAFKFSANLSPKYDKGEDVYIGLIKEINQGITMLDTTYPNAAEVTGEHDVIFQGVLANWKKFANTVKLRMLLRMSNVTDATVVAFRNQELQSFIGKSSADFITTDVTINPGFSDASADNLSPLYREFGRTDFTSTAFNNNWRVNRASDYYAKLVSGKSTLTTGVLDPRGTIQFRPVTSAVLGVTAGVSGIVQGTTDRPTGTSEASYSAINWKLYPVAGSNGSIDGYIMLGSEGYLLLAEAAVTYPAIFNGINAESSFNSAISSSFAFWGVPATSTAASYIAAISTKPGVGWAATSNKIEAIQYQRLVSLAIVRPMETYLNYLKTGYPNIPLAVNAEKPNKPYRLVYPATEYSSNSSNVPNISAADCFVKNQYTPFWLR